MPLYGVSWIRLAVATISTARVLLSRIFLLPVFRSTVSDASSCDENTSTIAPEAKLVGWLRVEYSLHQHLDAFSAALFLSAPPLPLRRRK